MRYKTVADLVAAFKAGDLTPDANELSLDNDCAAVYVHDEDWTPASTEKVFDAHPDDLLEQCLTLLGIPWERA